MKRTLILGTGQLTVFIWLPAHFAAQLFAADRVELREEPTDTQIRKVAVELDRERKKAVS